MSKEQNSDAMYALKLHQTIKVKEDVGNFFITRVIGGWIYRTTFEDINGVDRPQITFVPYMHQGDHEYQIMKSSHALGIPVDMP